MVDIPELVGASTEIAAVRWQLDRLLRHQSARMPPILLQGETGTGKGLLARAIHRAGPRRHGPFVDVNCAAIPETLLEAEMFGFERGAFTDARQAKPGLLEAAHRGTIFLDEVGLLPANLQAKLLKAIEEQSVRRLGSTRAHPIDVWVLSATSEDLPARTRAREFREDLYHRLALLTIQLPPLRDRAGDIELLAEHFLRRVAADYGQPPKQLDAAARVVLRAHRWPGNVRELANLIERAVLLSEGDVLTVDVLGLDAGGASPPPALSLDREVTDIERARVLAALEQAGWNVSHAAERLGISRNKLRYRIARYGLRRDGRPAPRRASPPAPRIPAAGPVEVAASPAPPRSGALRWESRRLVLLQARLASHGEARPSSEVGHLLETVVDKVRGFGGHVEELSAGGLLAVFGIDAVEDASTRAALAALAVLNAAQTARRAGGPTGPVTIALHVDHGLVGRLGTRVQLDAERKQQLRGRLDGLLAAGEPDTITLSTAAARVLERRFEVTPVSEPLTSSAYRLVGGGPAGLRRRVTRFVGRGAEVKFLRDRLEAAVTGRGQVVGISGEPGIGKSRLLAEFRRGLGDGEVTFLEGRCFSYLTAVPYAPVSQILRASLGLGDTDTGETIVDRARRTLAQVDMDAEDAPFLLLLLGVSEGTDPLAVLSPEAIKTRTFEILVELTLRGSRRRPLVLVAEDVHWIDTASEAFLALFVERMAGAPVLLVITYRPGYRPPGAERSYATQLALSPLSQEDSLSVVEGMAEQMPRPVASLILARAEGNPFFLEELTRAVTEQDGDPARGVPDTLQEVLLARVERLPDGARRVLRAASVFGREVPARLLAAMCEPDHALDAALRELLGLEFLFLRSAVEEPVYVFKHALTQEAVHDSIDPLERQTFHAAAGRALERLHGERLELVYDRLAYHHSNAGDTAKAIDYLRRFAARATRASAHVEAAAALEEALVHLARLPDGLARERLRLEVVLHRVHPLTLLGRFGEVLNGLLEEGERVERLGDSRVAGPYYFWLGRTHGVLGDQARAVEAARVALAHAEECGDAATGGKAYYVLAYADYWEGRARAGVAHGRQAVALLEGTDERFWLGLAHWVVAISHAHIGEFERGLVALQDAHAVAEETGDPQLRCTVAWSNGMMLAGLGDWQAGIAACRRAVEISPNPVNSALATGFLGACYLEEGDAHQAIPLLETSVEHLARFQIRQTQGFYLALLAEAYVLSGRLERASELATQALGVSQAAGYLYGVGWAQRALGRVALGRHSTREARVRFTDALHTFASVETLFEEGRTHVALADVATAEGDADGVTVHLTEALRAFQALQLARYVARVEARLRGPRS